jgi:hypothetical protein
MNQTLKIINFKNIEEKKFDLNGDILIFFGQHNSGKTTSMQAIETVILGKGFVKKPVRDGQTDAKIEYTGQDIEGNPITIIVDIDNENQYTFTAYTLVNGKMKQIHDVKKIRELVGVYFPLTSEDVLNMIKYVEGRREFINKYLLQVFTEEQQKRIEQLQLSISDKKSKATENNLYHKRASINKDLEELNMIIKTQTITEEEKEELKKKDAVITALNKLREELEPHKNDGVLKSTIENEIDDLISTGADIIYKITSIEKRYNKDLSEIKDVIDTNYKSILIELNEKIKNLWSADKVKEQEDRIQRGVEKKAQLDAIERKQTPDNSNLSERDKKATEWTEINQQIEKNKTEIKQIFSNSSLPAGLEINEDEILLNGQPLDSTVSGETETKIAIIELLLQITTSKFINVGNWSLYSDSAKEHIKALAKKYNRQMMGQEITSDDDVSLKTIIID